MPCFIKAFKFVWFEQRKCFYWKIYFYQCQFIIRPFQLFSSTNCFLEYFFYYLEWKYFSILPLQTSQKRKFLFLDQCLKCSTNGFLLYQIYFSSKSETHIRSSHIHNLMKIDKFIDFIQRKNIDKTFIDISI